MKKELEAPPDYDEAMLGSYEYWTETPHITDTYRVQTIVEADSPQYEVRTWVVDADEMEEFFTKYVGGDEKLVDVRPFEEIPPSTATEEADE